MYGLYSDANVKMLYKEGMHFTLPVPSSVTWQKELIDSCRKDIYSPGNLISDEETIIYAVTKCDLSSPYGRVWKHVYYDAARKERVVADLMKRINRCLDALDNGNALNASDSSFAEKYIIVKTVRKTHQKPFPLTGREMRSKSFSMTSRTLLQETGRSAIMIRVFSDVFSFSSLQSLQLLS